MSLFEGSCNGVARNVEIGPDNKNRMRVRWDMEVVDGPHKGKIAKYSGKLDPDNIKWTKRDMIAIGWQGQSSKTFVDDVKRASGRVVPFTAEIAEHEGRQWTSAKIGGGAPLGELTSEKANEVDRWFAEAGDVASQSNGEYRQDSESDIPF